MVEAPDISNEDRLLREEAAFKRAETVHEGKIQDCKYVLEHPRRGFHHIGTGGERDPTWAREENRPATLTVGTMIAISRKSVDDNPIDVAKIVRIFQDENKHVWARINWWEPRRGWGGSYTKTPRSLENIPLSDVPYMTPWIFVHWADPATDKGKQRPVLTTKSKLTAGVLTLAKIDLRLQEPFMKAKLRQ
jgi:hypothetical protein